MSCGSSVYAFDLIQIFDIFMAFIAFLWLFDISGVQSQTYNSESIQSNNKGSSDGFSKSAVDRSDK